ncbi:TPA: hypothetical protein DIV48_00620 [Candidatus Kaiserbacteria bacterium]|nr:MAG: hypothetical protein UY93_C0002G0415 [Parcubacteria group bacterium GW2011_GWA1_56_13]KKW46145.1 MAG: hypothetical protein UY97_C0009G0002 [Parcubacteria group bacterium GW2011_GWB1_57_6]HCR52135.1 hypothetical protein [Candidatus Kaiserbacteria bacterium]
MLERVLRFIKYNNAFTVALGVLFLGSGAAYAASPQVRDAVYSSKEVVVSVDNHVIITANLDNFDFGLRINAVTDDEKNYYVAYSYRTLAVEDSVWRTLFVEKILTVSKASLEGKDLGLHVTKELSDNVKDELTYLKRVQKLEQGKGESGKVVAVEYSGLVGRMLNARNGTIEGYTPVVPETAAVAAAAGDTSNVGAPVAPIIDPERPAQVAQTTQTTDTTTQRQPTQASTAASSPGPSQEEMATTTTSSGTGGETIATSTPSTSTTASSTPPETATTTVSSGDGSTSSSPDGTPPIVTLNGDAAMQLNKGDTWTDPGATAADNVDDDLTAHITVSGTVDTAVAGLYTLTYSATDAAGNTTSASRTVTVVDPAVTTSETTDISSMTIDTASNTTP